MTPNLLINQISSRSDMLLYFWCILAALGLAVLVAAARGIEGTHPAYPRLLFFSFALVAAVHLLASFWILKQWTAAANALAASEAWERGVSGARANLLPVLQEPPVPLLLGLHLAFDTFVLAGIWWMTRTRGDHQRNA